MKKMIIAAMALIAAVVTGCKSVPTTDDMYKVGYSTGFTTSYILNNQAKVDQTTKVTITNIVTMCEKYIPATNETFTAKWTPIMDKYLDGLVESGDLTEKQAARVRKDFVYVISLLDSYIDKKGIKQYQDLVDSFVYGFSDSILKYLIPSDTFSASSVNEDDFDKFTFGYLSRCFNK